MNFVCASADIVDRADPNMSTLELVLNMIAEATTTEISKTTEPQTFEENKHSAVVELLRIPAKKLKRIRKNQSLRKRTLLIFQAYC